MLVSKKHETEILEARVLSFAELVDKRYKVACIDIRAIFYSRASAESELLDWDDYTDETRFVLTGKL